MFAPIPKEEFGQLASVAFGVSFNFVAFQLAPEEWGYAVLLLLAGALFGACVAAYCGKAMGLESASERIVGKVLTNVSVVGMFGPAVLGWWIDFSGMQLEPAAPMVGGVISLFGVTFLFIIAPKIIALLRRINLLPLAGKSAVLEPEKPSANTPPTA